MMMHPAMMAQIQQSKLGLRLMMSCLSLVPHALAHLPQVHTVCARPCENSDDDGHANGTETRASGEGLASGAHDDDTRSLTPSHCIVASCVSFFFSRERSYVTTQQSVSRGRSLNAFSFVCVAQQKKLSLEHSLFVAVQNFRLPMVRALVEQYGVDVNATKDGSSMLMWGTRTCRLPIPPPHTHTRTTAAILPFGEGYIAHTFEEITRLPADRESFPLCRLLACSCLGSGSVDRHVSSRAQGGRALYESLKTGSHYPPLSPLVLLLMFVIAVHACPCS